MRRLAKCFGRRVWLVCAALAQIGVSSAADLPSRTSVLAPVPVMTQWEFAVAGYVWAPGIRGTLATIPPLPAVRVDASFGDIVKEFGFALMGSFEAKYGRYILFNDLMITKLNPEGGGVRGDVSVRVGIDSVSAIGLTAGGYRLIDSGQFILDVFAGVRGFYMDNKLSERVDANSFSRGASFAASKAWVDAVGGMRMRYHFDDNWFVNMITFAGGGASRYQWDVYGGAGYVFNSNWSAFAGYRAFKVDFRDGGFTYDVLQHGPLAGIQYRW